MLERVDVFEYICRFLTFDDTVMRTVCKNLMKSQKTWVQHQELAEQMLKLSMKDSSDGLKKKQGGNEGKIPHGYNGSDFRRRGRRERGSAASSLHVRRGERDRGRARGSRARGVRPIHDSN